MCNILQYKSHTEVENTGGLVHGHFRPGNE